MTPNQYTEQLSDTAVTFLAEAWEKLNTARDIKARAARGEAYDWEVSRIAIFVQLARMSMHISLHTRAMAQIGRNRNARVD